MDWFVRSADGREVGPMSESEVRASVLTGRAVAVRRGSSQVWVPANETPFSKPVVPLAHRLVGELTRHQAAQLISDGVAAGVLKAGIALWALSMLVFFVYYLVVRR
jgi:hypothetical protein